MKKELTAKQVSLCLNRKKCCRQLDIALENLELMILNYSSSTAQHSAKALFLESDYSVKLMSSIQRYKIPAYQHSVLRLNSNRIQPNPHHESPRNRKQFDLLWVYEQSKCSLNEINSCYISILLSCSITCWIQLFSLIYAVLLLCL